MPLFPDPTDELFMQRALDLAILGKGAVSPNPLVGSVLTYKGRIAGEGFHQRYGQAHAEVNAIAQTDPELLPFCTLYVNLEPCSHFGKTPPCADLIIRSGIRKVVVANQDPNPLVAGKGITKLREAGIEVVTGVLAQQAWELNQRFFTFILKKRPYILLKWAQTADGFVARENFDSKWISGPQARQLVHKWRSEEDSVLVGTQTALHDNPRLNVRDWTGRNPIRILIDRYLRVTQDLHLFDGSQQTLVYNLVKSEAQAGVEWIALPEQDFWHALFADLYNRKIGSVMVEGGSQILHTLIEQGLWDEARVFHNPQTFGKGIAAPPPPGIWRHSGQIDQDWYRIYQHPKHVALSVSG